VSWRGETIPGIGVLGPTAIVARRRIRRCFGRDAISRPGSGWCRARIRPAQAEAQGERRRVFPWPADALDVGSISCVALIGRASLRELLVISCLNRIAIGYRDCDTVALDVRVVLLVIRAVHLRPDMLTPTAAE
jgi:hypothetical protein